MKLRTRLGVTLAAMVAFSLMLHLAWHALFNFGMPAYLAGVAGGMVAVPVWEYLNYRHRRQAPPA